jgi:hypothetical protein
MYRQAEVFRSSATWPIGGTYRQDLPDSGMLAGISIHVSATPVTDSMNATEKWRLMDFISELKIVGNGNRMIKAITGQMQQGLAFIDGMPSLLDKMQNYGSSTWRYHTFIPFGRNPFDTECGLDLSAWDSVELQFTNDGSSTYFTGDWTITVILHWLREAAGAFSRGYFKTEEWRKWTTISDEWKYLDLPTENRLRKLVMQVIADVSATMTADATPYNVAYEIQLKLRSGAVDVFNGNLRDLWYDNAYRLGRVPLVGIEPYTTAAYGIHTGLGQSLAVGGVKLNHTAAESTYGPTLVPGNDGQTLQHYNASSGDQDGLIVAGLAFENCAFFPFDVPDVPESYLDLKGDGTVKLNVHTRSGAAYADGTIRVVLDQLVPHQGPSG